MAYISGPSRKEIIERRMMEESVKGALFGDFEVDVLSVQVEEDLLCEVSIHTIVSLSVGLVVSERIQHNVTSSPLIIRKLVCHNAIPRKPMAKSIKKEKGGVATDTESETCSQGHI